MARRSPTVLGRLVAARLVTTNADTVDVAHEALIREWPTLREWLSHDREALRVDRHLTEATQEMGAPRARHGRAVPWRPAGKCGRLGDRPSRGAQRRRSARSSRRRRTRRRARKTSATRNAGARSRRRSNWPRRRRRSARRLRRRALLLTGALVVAIAMAGAAVVLGMRGQQSATEAETELRQGREPAPRRRIEHAAPVAGQLPSWRRCWPCAAWTRTTHRRPTWACSGRRGWTLVTHGCRVACRWTRSTSLLMAAK